MGDSRQRIKWPERLSHRPFFVQSVTIFSHLRFGNSGRKEGPGVVRTGALAYIEDAVCRLMSRKNHVYRAYSELCTAIADDLRVESAVLDGEIVCLDEQGRSQFYDLFYQRPEPYFCAFNVLWLNREDLRDLLPLVEWKKRLRRLIPASSSRLLYLDHLEQHGRKLFDAACAHDLEGIVAKHKFRNLCVQRPAHVLGQNKKSVLLASRRPSGSVRSSARLMFLYQ